MAQKILIMESSDDFSTRLEKLVKDGTITKTEGLVFWENFQEDNDLLKRTVALVTEGKVVQSVAEAQWLKHIGSRPKLPTTSKTKKGGKSVGIDWLIWPLAFIIWLFVEASWPWIIAIGVRAWIWYTKERGKDKLVSVYHKKIPASVRANMGSSISNSAGIWFFEFFVLLIVVLNLFQVSGLIGFAGLIGAIILLRKPGQPQVLANGTLILPRPFLNIILGYPIGLFHGANEVGKNGVRLGFRFLISDNRTNIVGKSATFDVNSTVMQWLMGSASLTVKDAKNNAKTVKVARWAEPAEMENLLRKAVGTE